MSHFTADLASRGDVEFPKDGKQLMKIIREEIGEADAKDISPSPDALIDGWGLEMRLEGSFEKYVIRSAGPDKVIFPVSIT